MVPTADFGMRHPHTDRAPGQRTQGLTGPRLADRS
jgi:hypothetical protein